MESHTLCVFISNKNELHGLESTKPEGIIVEDCQGYAVRALGCCLADIRLALFPVRVSGDDSQSGGFCLYWILFLTRNT